MTAAAELSLVDMVRMVTRAEWGAHPPKRPLTPIAPSAITHCFIHNEGANIAPVGFDEERRRWAGIQQYTLRHPKYDYADIPYSFGVGQTGIVYEGRGWGYRDGATQDMRTSWSFCWIGNNETPSAAAVKALRWLCDEARAAVGRNIPVLGHRDNPKHPNATSCPGKALLDLIAAGTFNTNRQPEAEDPMPKPIYYIARHERTGHVYLLTGWEGHPAQTVLGHLDSAAQVNIAKKLYGAVDLGNQGALLDILLDAFPGPK